MRSRVSSARRGLRLPPEVVLVSEVDHEAPAINGGSRPVPDPTVLTDAAIAKEAVARQTAHEDLKKLLESRLLDRQHQVEWLDRLTEQATAHEREVSNLRFAAAERLATRESELNALALAAAFAAQKESAQKQDEYTRLSSSKAETATADAIAKLGELFNTQARAQGDKIDDLKDRVGRIESIAVGGIQQRTETRSSNAALYSLIGTVAGLIVLSLALVTFVIVHG